MTFPDVNKRLSDLDALLQIARAMSREQDLRSLMELIVDESTKMLQAERSSLYLVEEDKKELYTWIAEGLEIREVRLPFGKGIAGHVAATQELVNIPNAYEDPRFDPAWDRKTGFHTRNILCAPLITPEGAVVGVIQVLNKKDGSFTSYDEKLLSALCAHAAICIDNARLLQHYIEKERMQQSLLIAREIQQRLFPEAPPDIAGFDIAGFDIAGWARPCDETGGDYYDFIEMDDGRIALVIGDVSSHGVGPALLMTTARAFLRGLARQNLSPSEVLGNLNQLLERDMAEGRFMTMFYGVLHPRTKTIHYAAAGHEPALYLDGERLQFARIKSTGCPLGIFADMEYAEGEPLKMKKGDIFALFTDGIVEAMNADKQAFGREAVEEVILKHRDKSAREIIERVYGAVCDFCGDVPFRDDLTMVVVKVEE